jgi:hypothetical protein
MIVVESLSDDNLACPAELDELRVLELEPSSSVISSAPVRIAMSSSIRLRESPTWGGRRQAVDRTDRADTKAPARGPW